MSGEIIPPILLLAVVMMLPMFLAVAAMKGWSVYTNTRIEAEVERRLAESYPTQDFVQKLRDRQGSTVAPAPPHPQYKTGSILGAVAWMIGLSLLLFWMPLLGPIIAGVVGGSRAGSLGNALIAVFLPSILFGAAIFMFASTLTGIPLIGMAFGIGGVGLAAVHVGPLLVGALIGGLIAR